MCFSIKISKNIQSLNKIFKASLSARDTESVQKLFKAQEEMSQVKFETSLGLPHTKKRPTVFRFPDDDDRVFPGYFANVVVQDGAERLLMPMRYRVRPEGSKEEIPDNFGVYNARLDSLTSKKTWQPLFMRKHGLVPFTNFYEWVPDPDLGLFNFLDQDDKAMLGDNPKKKLISFYPTGREVMWAPCLWDEWTSQDGELSFKSFAIITTDPPREVEIMGHDRCPIFLKEEYISEWLNPQSSNVDEIFQILNQKEDVKFFYKWA